MKGTRKNEKKGENVAKKRPTNEERQDCGRKAR